MDEASTDLGGIHDGPNASAFCECNIPTLIPRFRLSVKENELEKNDPFPFHLKPEVSSIF
jgi:hypothetical protein